MFAYKIIYFYSMTQMLSEEFVVSWNVMLQAKSMTTLSFLVYIYRADTSMCYYDINSLGFERK